MTEELIKENTKIGIVDKRPGDILYIGRPIGRAIFNCHLANC